MTATTIHSRRRSGQAPPAARPYGLAACESVQQLVQQPADHVSLILIYWAVTGFFRWMLTQADWRPVLPSHALPGRAVPPRPALAVGRGNRLASLLLGLSLRGWGRVMRMVALTYVVFLLAVALWPVQAPALTLEMRIFLAQPAPDRPRLPAHSHHAGSRCATCWRLAAEPGHHPGAAARLQRLQRGTAGLYPAVGRAAGYPAAVRRGDHPVLPDRRSAGPGTALFAAGRAHVQHYFH
jgi:hypothetical protein